MRWRGSHFPKREFGVSGRWTDAERDEYYNVIKRYNIAAVFSGHHQLADRVDWNGAKGATTYEEKS
jgi:hypothetical protein